MNPVTLQDSVVALKRCYPSEHRSYMCMLGRCTYPEARGWKYYGGKGIKVCDRWRGSFFLFMFDMGTKPSRKHTIDRLDNSKGYEPSNCRWASKSEQANNQTPAPTFRWWKGKKLPTLCRHKKNNTGYVTDPVTGRQIVMGKWGQLVTLIRYHDWTAKWVAERDKAEKK